ncbi:MAG: hypothetical protein AVDCRST_MAG72-1638 [uncultured Nocardioidaceae bacterium]|uniref:Uncharacterized protein n=1 Tax=uncultured Nocardioidaceae bacterium TaxID=253824 RepID=A0A6J4MFU0_9ACTN|nr:MAG: hypothetical protein AVDCRST_MAG72-1638 [uncultured Nocardioidaceae bacterium]
MTSPRPTHRRPPSPFSQFATVTELGPPAGQGPDEVARMSVQGTLALDLDTCRGLPATPELRPSLEVVEGRSIDDISLWSARFAQAVVEVVGGDRPVTQLVRWTTSRVYNDLTRRVRIVARASAGDPRLRVIRPQVRSVHVFLPTQSAAEVSVHVRHGQRARAMAARMERDDGRWRCTALQLG